MMKTQQVKVWVNVVVVCCIQIIACSTPAAENHAPAGERKVIRELNAGEIEAGSKTIAIVDVTIIDGNGGTPVENGTVIVKGNKIEAVGKSSAVKLPQHVEVIDGKGMSLLPGFIDSHFHLDNMTGLPALFLQHGVTSVRDPGAWNEAYNGERESGKMIPRLFLCGPHLDMYPPAYPHDAYVVRDSIEAVNQVNRAANEGATAIKVYFRLSPQLIRVVCNAAHARGLPVTAHLEITEAMEAIEQGLDGIEHITSFGLSLQPKREAEKYRQMVLNDNDARKQGRYEVWKNIDVNGKMVDSLAKYLAKKGTFVSPTLGPFEYQPADGVTDTVRLTGFNHMKAVTKKLKEAGVRIVLGSHSSIPYAETGWAFQREMELFAESGISNADIIVAATMQNARFFRIDDRLGSIEKGKIADLLLVKGNPLQDIKAVRNISRVMLNGKWVSMGQ
ncbi:MAG: amidohydrolase family protein [Agriterribacter sp.]